MFSSPVSPQFIFCSAGLTFPDVCLMMQKYLWMWHWNKLKVHLISQVSPINSSVWCRAFNWLWPNLGIYQYLQRQGVTSDANRWRKRFEHSISLLKAGRLDGSFPQMCMLWSPVKTRRGKQYSDRLLHWGSTSWKVSRIPPCHPGPSQKGLEPPNPVGHSLSNEFLPSGFQKW